MDTYNLNLEIAFVDAINKGDLNKVKKLFIKINPKRYDINSVLRMTISKKQLTIAKWAIDNGAKIDHWIINTSNICKGNIKVVQFLFENGARIFYLIDNFYFDYSKLSWASDLCSDKILLAYLISKGLDINFANGFLLRAVLVYFDSFYYKGENYQKILNLLDLGADLNLIDERLKYAITSKSIKMIKYWSENLDLTFDIVQ